MFFMVKNRNQFCGEDYSKYLIINSFFVSECNEISNLDLIRSIFIIVKKEEDFD